MSKTPAMRAQPSNWWSRQCCDARKKPRSLAGKSKTIQKGNDPAASMKKYRIILLLALSMPLTAQSFVDTDYRGEFFRGYGCLVCINWQKIRVQVLQISMTLLLSFTVS